ncbi:hypothetical protein SPI_01223 [Niveomyces insectorum RCEF 264]|uniref:Meiotic recombination protein DMC1 n=1 Tax=Niveomyces insectorum RCEF 264 TaxID=1081102 RepID=A0A167YSU3_9HYPO|nr:hypothetical protein SPI_01223 [Niveomyces insectorum RCEF 264]
MAGAAPSSPSPPPGPGGFFPPTDTGLLSPTPSQASSVLRNHAAGLPHPRRQPLRPGSAKEDLVRRYAEERMLHISRRFVKKHGIPAPDDTVVGYRSMGELCRDVDGLLNNLWKSGTPNLQVQYLLNLASELVTWMDGFPPSPRATLAVLSKLDHCFASLLAGRDTSTGEPLPGFGANPRAGLSRTDMVRCRSIAERSRVAVVDVFRRGPPDPSDEADRYYRSRPRPGRRRGTTDDDDDPPSRSVQRNQLQNDEPMDMDGDDDEHHAGTLADEVGDDDDDDNDDDEVEMGLGSVYELTLVKLGELLGDSYGQIGGIPTMPRSHENDDDEY